MIKIITNDTTPETMGPIIGGASVAPPTPSEVSLDRQTRLDLSIRLHHVATDARDLCVAAEITLAEAKTVRALLKRAELTLMEGKAGATEMLLRMAERVMARPCRCGKVGVGRGKDVVLAC